MSDPGGDDLEQELRRACALLQRGLRQGETARAEQFLQQFPALAEQADRAVELIYAEFVIREQLGQQPTADEYCERFPQWRQELRDQFQVHRLLDERPSLPTVPGPLGAYDLIEVIGHGAVSMVYRARQRELDRPTAIKLLLPASDTELTRRYHTESALAARFSHPNILQIYEAGEYQGRGYLALEFVAGGTLADRLRGEPQPPPAAAALTRTLADAVAHIHQRGVIHRDLKPANILLALPATGHWAQATPKIADFSLAIPRDEPPAPGIAGTPSYMAPEQAGDGLLTPAADVWGLGAILYELLTGRPPFRGDTPLNTIQQVLEQEPVPPRQLQPGVPTDLQTICLKCLAKDARRRYVSAGDLAEDLRRFQAGEPIRARPAGMVERAWKWSRRQPARAALLAVSVAAMLTITLGSLWYNVRLRDAADVETRLKADALKQLDAARQSLYTIQLAQVEELQRTDPGRALEMLEDETACPPSLRDFAWGMFYHICRQDLRTLRGPGGAITAVAIAPNGQAIAALAGRHVIVWNSAGAELACWPGDDTRGLVFTTNDQVNLLHADGGCDLIKIGDTSAVMKETGRPLPATAFALSPAGQEIAIAGDDTAVRIEDRHGKVRVERNLGGVGPLLAVAYASDGQTLALGGTRDGVITLCRADTLETVGRVKGHLKPVRALAFSRDGTLLASAGDDREVKLWKLPELTPAGHFKGHTGIVRGLAFTADGLVLASASDDGTVRLWSPRPPPAETVATPARKIVCLAYTPDGRTLIAGRDDGSVVWHDPQTARVEAVHVCHDDAVLCLAISPDGTVLATGGDNGEIRLWDRAMKPLARLPGHQRRVRAITISPDSKRVASAGEDGSVRLWDIAQQRQVAEFKSMLGSVRSVGFSPDGQTLAAGNNDGSVSLWDVRSGQERERIQAGKRLLLISQFSPDGRLLVTGGLDYLVGLWTMPAGQRHAVLTGHTEYVFSAAFTPDGRTLASGSGNRFTDIPGEVKLWDVATGQVRATLAGQTGPVAFSPDGRTLATVDRYTTIRLWRSTLPPR